MKKSAAQINTDHLRARLKLKSLQSGSLLKAHHPEAVAQLETVGVRVRNLRAHAARVLTSSITMASLMLPPATHAPISTPTPEVSPFTPNTAHTSLQIQLKNLLPASISHLSPQSETEITQIIHSTYGIHAYPELDGNRLNDTYGYLGAEQHLPRFPGDTIDQHDDYQESGLTPGRGAWGYFAPSKNTLTPDLVDKEKYYFAVQTLYLPDWSSRLSYLRDWYKYRKMVAINPMNGKAIVGVVADSGPAWWTGKVFGASPEIMGYLNMRDGRQKGAIILYFVDDPQNQIPLGPLEYNLEKPPLMLAS